MSALTAATAVEVDMPDDLPFVRADPVLTERILLNLLHNAVRHGAPPIRIEVRIASASIDLAVVDAGPRRGFDDPRVDLRAVFRRR